MVNISKKLIEIYKTILENLNSNLMIIPHQINIY